MTDMDGQNIQAFSSSNISSFSVNSLPSASMTCHRQSGCIAQLDKAPDAFRDEYEPDTDDEPESSQQEGPTTISNKRRVENAVFKQYASKLAEAFTEKDLKKAFKQSHAEQPLSVKELLAQDESSERITDPRDYQIELFERAKQKNIIAVLETGAGKTHIATLLLRWVLDKELEDRRDGKEHKTAFFLVNSINLVFQQANVLRVGLDHAVEGVCGGSGGHSLWEKRTWQKLVTDNMVVVCTGEVLHQCLMHSFVKMKQINLLIFDEAHHAKMNHAYARQVQGCNRCGFRCLKLILRRIIKDSYVSAAEHDRPRVFGMTASPVDAKVDVQEAAMELETLLHCEIATTSDTLLRNNISLPKEEVLFYRPIQSPFKTDLQLALSSRLGTDAPFTKLFKTAEAISAELGPWCANTFWSFAFSEEATQKLERRTQFEGHMTRRKLAELDEKIKKLRQAEEIVKDYPFVQVPYEENDLSSKVLALRNCLLTHFEENAHHRCIVFVERRATARLLHSVFTYIGGVHIRPGVLVGVSFNVAGDATQSLRSQIMTTTRFKSGALNCLFATSVAEEGLDIQQCSIVIRFDLYKTMISYVQSRGRARHKDSKFIHMLEDGNLKHREAYNEAKSSEYVMRRFCQSLPQDRVIQKEDVSMEELMAEERNFPFYQDPHTGAKLTYSTCLQVLSNFVDSLPKEGDGPETANYVLSICDDKFVCEVILPQISPVRSAVGRPHSKKTIAKRSAAFEACLQLWKKKFLNEHFLSTFSKVLPIMRNAQLALDVSMKHTYPVKAKPDMWARGRDRLPEKLFMTIIDVSDGLDRPYQPLALLTRECLPTLPAFPLYLNSRKITQALTRRFKGALQVTNSEITLFNNFTLRIWSDIFNKKFEDSPAKMSYWLAPVGSRGQGSEHSLVAPRDYIDWETLREVSDHEEYPWMTDMPDDFLKDRYLVDRFHGGRRYFTKCVVADMSPTDVIEYTTSNGKSIRSSVLDWTAGGGPGRKESVRSRSNLSQPVLSAISIGFRRDFCSEYMKEPNQLLECFICPEPLKISSLPSDVVAMCYVFPAILYRIESYLIALDATKLLGLDIGAALALEALTKDSDNTEEHGQIQLNLRRGMGNNYERLEFLGDCFLKLATSLSLFVMVPRESEFEYHVRRMCMLCNNNLFRVAQSLGLPEFVRSKSFSRRTWYPEGLKMLEGKGSKKQDDLTHQVLGDKTVADVCEAFIGAAFLEHNKHGNWTAASWEEAVKAVTKLVDSEDHTMNRWQDYTTAYEKTASPSAPPAAAHLELVKKLKAQHDYSFKNPRLARSAFCHPSQPYVWERIPSYQRLEFLGDALLDMVFVSHLFYSYPDKDPQWLTEHKMPMVANKFLGAVCVKLGFHTHLCHNSPSLRGQIMEYVSDLENAEKDAAGKMDYWESARDPPKCLADIVEAYAGAVFIDSGFDYSQVQRFFDEHIKCYFTDMSVYDSFAGNHPQTHLQRRIQDELGCRDWRLRTLPILSVLPGAQSMVISMVMIHGSVICDGDVRSSARYGRIKACQNALAMLDGYTKEQYRARVGCDCSDGDADADAEEMVI